MKANTRYVLTYDSSGELSIDESEDSSLTGFTVICGRNNGPDELVFCLQVFCCCKWLLGPAIKEI